MMTDPIADMLTRIRNASLAHKKEVVVSFSKIKKGIAEIMAGVGYLEKVEERKNIFSELVLTLKYTHSQPAIQHIKRISTPGHRNYVKKDEMKPILSGFGVAIISTPKGLLTDVEARKLKVGGEVICEIY